MEKIGNYQNKEFWSINLSRDNLENISDEALIIFSETASFPDNLFYKLPANIIIFGKNSKEIADKIDEFSRKMDCENIPQITWSLGFLEEVINLLFRPSVWGDYTNVKKVCIAGAPKNISVLKEYLEKIKDADPDSLPTKLDEVSGNGSILPLTQNIEDKFEKSINDWEKMSYSETRKYLGSHSVSYRDSIQNLTYQISTEIEKSSPEEILIKSTLKYPGGKELTKQIAKKP